MKHRLGKVRKIFYSRSLTSFTEPTSPLVQKWIKVSKGAKIRNRYNQLPHLTQDTNGKVTYSQLDTTNESQEVSPFPAGDYKVSKGAKIRNRYNQVPHLTQNTNGKVTNSQLDTTNESQEVSPFPAGDHKAHINRRAQRHSKHTTEKKHKTSIKEDTKMFPPPRASAAVCSEVVNLF